MTFFGLGGFEILVIAGIALFVLGPKRLIDGIRDGRKIYSDLKRQRDVLQSLITEAIDLEELKKELDVDGLKESAKSLESELALDQIADDVREATELAGGSIPRGWKSNKPPVEVDPDVRKSIPDLKLSGGSSDDGDEVTRPEADADVDEVKS